MLQAGKIKKIALRSTLTQVEDQLSEVDRLFKTHRAFLVNLNYIQNVTGNAQGLRLELTDEFKEIPVARSRVKAFRTIATG